MSNFKHLASIAVIICICCSVQVNCFSWEDCGNEDSVIHFDHISIKPDEPELNKDLYLNAKMTLDETIENGTISSLHVTRFVGRIIQLPVPMPCLSGFGSCKSSFCDVFQSGEVCKYIRKAKDDCGCPLNAGVYRSRKLKPIKLQAQSDIQRLIARGRYKVEWKLLSAENAELGCLKLDFTLK